MTPTMAMVVAIGLTSAVCYALLVRADRRPNRRRSSADSTSVDSDGGGPAPVRAAVSQVGFPIPRRTSWETRSTAEVTVATVVEGTVVVATELRLLDRRPPLLFGGNFDLRQARTVGGILD